MKRERRSALPLVCLTVLLAAAILAAAGCLESGGSLQDAAPHSPEIPAGQPAAGSTATPVALQPSVQATQVTAAPARETSGPYIRIDPVGDRKIGDLVIISGTTNLPAGTTVLLIREESPAGGEKMISNRPVFTGTNGTSRWRFVLDTSGYQPGAYAYAVKSQDKKVSGSVQFSLGGTARGPVTPVFYAGPATGSPGAPVITVRPVGDHDQGDAFLIAGTTTLPGSTILMYRVYPAYFEDRSKRPSGAVNPSGVAGDTIVLPGTGGTNAWSCALDTTGYEKTGYIVNVSTMSEDGLRTDVFGSVHFAIR